VDGACLDVKYSDIIAQVLRRLKRNTSLRLEQRECISRLAELNSVHRETEKREEDNRDGNRCQQRIIFKASRRRAHADRDRGEGEVVHLKTLETCD
jgi:hypothetical protein